VLFACGLVGGYGLLPIVPPPPFMAGLMLLTGLFLAPMLASTFILISDLAPRGTTTEAFAWLVTLFAAGNSFGAAAVGSVLDTGNLHRAAAGASFGALVCLLLLIVGYRLLAPVAEPVGQLRSG
jgi:predicted MFS family arabinose efflux permease